MDFDIYKSKQNQSKINAVKGTPLPAARLGLKSIDKGGGIMASWADRSEAYTKPKGSLATKQFQATGRKDPTKPECKFNIELDVILTFLGCRRPWHPAICLTYFMVEPTISRIQPGIRFSRFSAVETP